MSINGTLSYVALTRGDPFPWQPLRDGKSAKFAFHTVAGRYLVFCFFTSAASAEAEVASAAIQRHRTLFDGERALLFGISIVPTDTEAGRFEEALPGIRHLLDGDGEISQTCGALPNEGGQPIGPDVFQPCWIIVDPTLRVLAKVPLTDQPDDADTALRFVETLPSPGHYAGFELPVPVLLIPNVLEQHVCRHLVGLYDLNGGTESGIFRAGGSAHDHSFKRRKDYTIEDQQLIRLLQGKIKDRVLPEIERLFFMKITRMERYIVGCYAAEDNAHLKPHRDNGPGLTAHRRYAVSINLTDDFDGGEVSFPEYSRRGFKAPKGWAVVFPAAILHAVSQATYGRRYAFLPFVYDEEGAKIRQVELDRYHAAAGPK